uniref:Peptidase S1 domain-containing protein n=1 Tax=Strigamia maritima TaxID=126957 RepID=T1J7P7_STRMM
MCDYNVICKDVADWEIACGQKQPALLNSPHRVIKSESVNGVYSPNLSCSWLISAPSRQEIKLTFLKLNMENSKNCSNDRIDIYDGELSENHKIHSFCGKIKINEPDCSDVIHLNDTHGVITSPDYDENNPFNKYPPNTTVQWKITAPEGHFIQLHFLFMNIERSNSCERCGPNELMCATKNCISNEKRCNGVNNCPNQIDEINCIIPKSSLRECGIPAVAVTDIGPRPRIIGGRVSKHGNWPWQGALSIVSFNWEFQCGAIIIHPEWILTAAHCFRKISKPDRWALQVGKHNLSAREESAHERSIDKIIIHPKFGDKVPSSPFRNANDIALVHVRRPLEYTDYVIPACLPRPFEPIEKDIKIHVTGFGKTENFTNIGLLKQVELPVINQSICNEIHKNTLSDSMFCAGGQSGHDSCQGDSGGPAVVNYFGRWKLLGIVSWGDECAVEDKPGVYTKVSHFIPWIEETTGIRFTSTFANNLKDYCRIETTSGRSERFTILERTAKGVAIGHLIATHDATISSADVTLKLVTDNDEFSRFISIGAGESTKDPTRTQFTFFIKEEYDLFEHSQVAELIQILNCAPNTAPATDDIHLFITFTDENDRPEFSLTSMTYKLPRLPLKLPFSKMYTPIYVTDKDKENTDNGNLEFFVWTDANLKTKSQVLSAEGEKVGTNKYLVNLYLLQLLDAATSPEYNVILMAKDTGTKPLDATIPIKIIVESEEKENPNLPKFENTAKYYFSMNSLSGEVSLVDERPLIENRLTSVSLFIQVVVNNDKLLSDFSILTIKIIYAPQFERDSYSVYTYRDADLGTILWTANAGPLLVYSVNKDTSNLQGYYMLDSKSGSLSISSSLEKAGDKKIEIIASTVGVTVGYHSTEVTIHVLDRKNDQVLEKKCSIEENVENALCDGLTMTQSDNYQIISGNNDQVFEISNSQLRCKPQLDYEKTNFYNLVLRSETADQTIYLTVNVKDVKEAPYFETVSHIFAIAPWIQPDNRITTFRVSKIIAQDPESIFTKTSDLEYVFTNPDNLSNVFRLNSISGELHWMKTPSEKFYEAEIEATNKRQDPQSTYLNIKARYSCSDIFTLKLIVQSNSELDTNPKSIEKDLSTILKAQVVLILSKPDLNSDSESTFVYVLFAVVNDVVLSYQQIEKNLITSKEETEEKLGKFILQPHSSLLGAQENETGQPEQKLVIIIILSVIVCAMLVAIIGIVLFKKCSSSAPLQNDTSSKEVLRNGQIFSDSGVKIDIDKIDGKTKSSKMDEGQGRDNPSFQVSSEEVQTTTPSPTVKTATLTRLVNENEITFGEITEEHADDLHEIQVLEMDYELPAIDYKPGKRKSVSFIDANTVFTAPEEDEDDHENKNDNENSQIEPVDAPTASPPIDKIVENEESGEKNQEDALTPQVQIKCGIIEELYDPENQDKIEEFVLSAYM